MQNSRAWKVDFFKSVACSWKHWGWSDSQSTHCIARRHLPVGRVITEWESHKAFFNTSHETLGQKIFCVVISLCCEYRILLSITKAFIEKHCGWRIWDWEFQLWKNRAGWEEGMAKVQANLLSLCGGIGHLGFCFLAPSPISCLGELSHCVWC